MRTIRAKNTKPELLVRGVLDYLGVGYRIHDADLPGKPDVVLPRTRQVIFVQGCFWHQHRQCPDGQVPATRREYWEPKLARTRERDEAHRCALVSDGWHVNVIWECQAEEPEVLLDLLAEISLLESTAAG